MIKNIVTRGFGNGTFSGTIALMVTRGFGIGSAIATITGSWSNVIDCHGNADRIACHGNQERVTI